MTIYDDILPARPQHMNEDPHCPWKECERCRRVFNVLIDGMTVLTWKYGDGLGEGKQTNPNGPTFTEINCFQCARGKRIRE